MTILPSDETLNIAIFVRLFNHVTTSYKFLWMLGILDMLECNQNDDTGKIEMQDIVRRMLITADAPLNRYRLSLGAQDKIKKHIEKWQNAKRGKKRRKDDSIQSGVSSESKEEKALREISHELKTYVPIRLLVPFFDKKTKPEDIPDLADKQFDSSAPPLYRMAFKSDPLCIVVHPSWRQYLLQHIEIIRGWVRYNWVDYLQARNPYVPSIINKIAHPTRRNSLSNERDWWGGVIRRYGRVKCIYSGKDIHGHDKFQLDHYVPWSYVGHNRLWNLIPVIPGANSSKNDWLPHEKYYSKFLKMQHCALAAGLQSRKYENIISAYTDDLKIEMNNPPQVDKLHEKYDDVIGSLMTLAYKQGFPSGWTYDASRLTSRKGY